MIKRFFKRTVDIFGSSLGLLVLLPFSPFIILAIKLNSQGPALVALPRISNGRVILVYKFRSMVENATMLKKELWPQNERLDGPFFKIKNDPRLTKVGKILRKFRIDEFPQLINVLKNELSLVGPRPHEPAETSQYPIRFQHLLQTQAGVTGLSQISGASSLPFLKELELDDYYISHWSPWLDFKIVIKTIAILLFDPTAV